MCTAELTLPITHVLSAKQVAAGKTGSLARHASLQSLMSLCHRFWIKQEIRLHAIAVNKKLCHCSVRSRISTLTLNNVQLTAFGKLSKEHVLLGIAGKPYWEQAGVFKRIELIEGPASDSLKHLIKVDDHKRRA